MKNTTKKVLGVITTLAMTLAFVSPVFAATLTRQLEFGMTGSDVSSLQTFLAADPTIYPQGLVTGYFGFLTKAAVSNFQSHNGISSVGRVGPITLAAINARMNGTVGTGTQSGSPVINSLSINTSSSTATFMWNTTTYDTGTVYYSTSPLNMTEASATSGVVISGNILTVNTGMQTSHSGMITGLQPNTTYYYVVYVKDAAGNENISSWPATFTTQSQ